MSGLVGPDGHDGTGVDPTDPDLFGCAGPTLERLRDEGRIRHVHTVPKRAADTARWPDWVPDVVVERLAARGVTAPWAHQVAAAEAAHDGRSVVLATGTASGKSLGYLLPVIAATLPGSAGSRRVEGRGDGEETTIERVRHLRQLTTDPQRPGTALYLAPTKALAHDQLRAARELQIPRWRVGALDGDSDSEEREFARRYAGFVLSNPDMLHFSVLPSHRRWADLLARLRYVVIDEAHRYRGVFGSQIALVVRRLRRLCAHYGADPVIIAASATTGDPARSLARLTGLHPDNIEVVDRDASPHASVTHALVDAGEQVIDISAGLLADLAQPTPEPAEGRPSPEPVEGRPSPELVEGPEHSQSTSSQVVAFVPSRKLCEIVAVEAQRRNRGATIEAYRGGYLASERRNLEARLTAGTLHGVAATNALELGIDIAGLDAVVIAGIPGSLASYWQQAGRAGRRGRPALVVALGGIDQRDSHLLAHPELIFERPAEPTVLDPDNPRLLGGQLACAAQELPLQEADAEWFGPAMAPVLAALTRQGVLRHRGSGSAARWHWTRADRAVDLVDLRAQGGRGIQIVEVDTARVIGHVDPSAADAAVHSGAVYLHRGEAHLVRELDHGEGLALVTTGSPGWTTQPQSTRSVSILAERESRRFGAGTLHRGDVEVTSQVTGYLRRDEVSGTVWDHNDLDLPVRRLRTRATWWTLPDPEALGLSDLQLGAAAHGAEHCAIGLLGVFVDSDRWDVGGLSTVVHPDTGTLTVFVHDGHPGGAGFADRGYRVADNWWAATLERLEQCPCEDGCPACVISPKCGNANQMLDKAAATILLRHLLPT